DFLAKSLRTILDKHIDYSDKVTTGDCKGYRPIKDFNITQISSNKGERFPILHTMIHQVKTWMRTAYSCVSAFNINRYLSEFCFRINLSQSKKTIFNYLIKRMVNRKPVSQDELECN